MDSLVYIALGFLGIYVYLSLRPRNKKGKPIPGPKGWPIVGSGLGLKRENLPPTFLRYAEQYGEIFKLNIFGSTFVVLNSAELVRKAFTTDPYKKIMNDRAKMFYGEKILFGSQSIAFTQNAFGSSHGDLRKGFTKAVHVYGEGKKQFEDLVKSQLVRLVEEIESYDGQEFDIQALIKRTLTNILSILLGDHRLDEEEASMAMFWEFDRANDFLLNAKVDTLLQTFPALRFVPSIYKQRYDEIVHANTAITQKYFHDIRATHTPGIVRGLVDYLIDEQLQATEKGGDVLITDEKIIAMVLETITAGVITTLGTMSTLFLCLISNPEYQAKIQQELDTVIGRDRLPSFEDKQNCPVTEAVSMESQRISSTLPLLVAHLCQQNIDFEGYDMPAYSAIVPNVWFMHHDENVWGDPWSFRPERFLDRDEGIIPNDHPLRKSWLPFGTGRRQCIAESFARSRVFLFVATLLQRLTFHVPPGQHVPSCDPRRGDFQFATTCLPKPFMCRVKPRELLGCLSTIIIHVYDISEKRTFENKIVDM